MEKIIPENELKKIKKILIIQYKPFGDILLNTGYMPALREKFPKAQIDYLIQKPYTTLLEDNPNLDNLVIMKKFKQGSFAYYLERIKVIIKVNKLGYDLIIDQIRGPGSAQITAFSGAKFRLGWNKTAKWSWLKGYNWVYNYRAKRNNLIYYSRAKFLVLASLGIQESPHNTFYHIKPESKKSIEKWLKEVKIFGKKIILFSPVTPVQKKQWEFERFAKVADMIKENNNCEIVLMWGPGEKERVELMASQMKHKAILAPKTSFNEAGALLQHTQIYIGNDGGINHLAVALETPTIAIFGPKTNPKKWTAWHLPIHKYLRDFNLRKYVDGKFNISPEMVYEKFEELLKIL